MKFRAMIQLNGKTTTGILIPAEVVEKIGHGKRPPVRVTINGHTYRSSVASMGGKYMVGVNAEHRMSAGVAAGDEVDVDIELDTEPREVTVPPDFAKALDHDAEAKRSFDKMSYSHKLQHVLAIRQAKSADTRQRRIDKAVSMLKKGKT